MLEIVMWGVHALTTGAANRLFVSMRSVYLPEKIDEADGDSSR